MPSPGLWGKVSARRTLAERIKSHCVILKDGVPLANLEVTADYDEDFQQASALAFDQPDLLIRDLPPHCGEWAIQFEPGVRIRDVSDDLLQSLVLQLVRDRRTYFDSFENDSGSWAMRRYVDAGVVLVFRTGNDQVNRAQILIGRRPGSVFISSERGLYAEYLREFLRQDRIARKIELLRGRSHDVQAWMALIVGNGSPNSVVFRSRGISFDPGLPLEHFELTGGLESLWLFNEVLIPQFAIFRDGRFRTIEEIAR
jgi:hypothetical protein